jgi:hypothetical protein
MYLPTTRAPAVFVRPGGLGFFDSFDLSSWGLAEWGSILVGGYLVASLVGDVGAARKRVRKARSSRQFRKREAERLRKRLAEL